MSWAVRSLSGRRHRYSTAARHAEPLRILFCGADDFSIASLHALHRARARDPALIHDIHVAHRPAKPTGRGLKTLREVPIRRAAAALALPTTELDTFTGWTPPFAFDLVVAVSFGLLVPPRILRLARHGGLNVHPSLLPDLRGAAPIEHALLKQRAHTGVTVQTLHPTTLDAGIVLAQSPPPGIAIRPAETRDQLAARLAHAGADLLLHVLHTRAFVPPLPDHGAWYAGPTDPAPKTSKQDRRVDVAAMSLDRILAVQRALGDPWCVLPNGERLVLHGVREGGDADADADSHVPQGLSYRESTRELIFRAACGRVGVVASSTYPGGKAGSGNAKAARILRAHAHAHAHA